MKWDYDGEVRELVEVQLEVQSVVERILHFVLDFVVLALCRHMHLLLILASFSE
jgi:hypothetical protein